MNKFFFAIILIALMSSCIPENLKNELDTGIAKGQHMLADQEFKKAIAHIELHKLRNGTILQLCRVEVPDTHGLVDLPPRRLYKA